MKIVHTCHRCGHHDTAGWSPADQADGAPVGNDRYEWPRQSCLQGCCKTCEWSEPVTTPTYTWPHELEQHVYPPGKPWSSGVVTCGCVDCTALYREVTSQ